MIIVSCSKEKDASNTLLYKSVNSKYPLKIICNNSAPIAEVYNGFIEEYFEQDMIVFCHDDITLLEKNLEHKLKQLQNPQTGIIGVAGTRGPINLKVPALWHLMADRNTLVGKVKHYTKDQSQYFMTDFGDTNTRSLLVDGLFLAINPKTLIDNDIRFDTKYPSKFHFYDLDISLQCYYKKLKTFVYDIDLIHASHGLNSFENKEWQLGQEYFLKKWIDIYES